MSEIIFWLSVFVLVIIITEVLIVLIRNTVKAVEKVNPMGLKLDSERGKKVI